jgi:hypothetical protein
MRLHRARGALGFGADLIGWVDTLCKDWAAHKIRVYGQPAQQPIPGTLGNVRSEGLSAIKAGAKRVGRQPIRSVATRNTPEQHHQEVFSRNALAVAQAVADLPAEKLAVLTVHYLYPCHVQKKLSLVHVLHGKPLNLRTYYRRIHGVHCWIASRIS